MKMRRNMVLKGRLLFVPFMFLTTSCATGQTGIEQDTARTPQSYQNVIDPASRDLRIMPPADRAVGSTSIDQISGTRSQLSAPQISSATEEVILTIGQLKAYADRCIPDANMPPPPDLDCSELKLRIDRTFKTEDALADALAVLDRLGRSDNADEVARRLNNGELASSLDAQAIANGILDPSIPRPEDITLSGTDLEEFSTSDAKR